MKICSHCREERDLAAFSKDRRRPDGLSYRCRACVNLEYQKNAEKRRAYQKAYRAKNPEKIKNEKINKANKDTYTRRKNASPGKPLFRAGENRDVLKKSDRKPSSDRTTSTSKQRQEYMAWNTARKINRAPSWADRSALRAIYDECDKLQADTGIEHRVAHIVPLRGKLVSGLHVARNLHIISMHRSKEPRLSDADKKDRANKAARRRRKEHPQLYRKACDEYYRRNLGASRERTAWREALKLERVPPWADRAAIRALFDECEKMNERTGVKHCVAHIIPLQRKFESGLHIAGNLQIIPVPDRKASVS